jgi:thiamine pyrophosphate-dependent acetolactate synthase large subunit-like protein
MFFADTGTAVMWLARHIKGGRNRRLFGSFSCASMANAAPNAFGAQLAYPGRRDGGGVVCAKGCGAKLEAVISGPCAMDT